jgi:hypothetical protein
MFIFHTQIHPALNIAPLNLTLDKRDGAVSGRVQETRHQH